MRPPRSPVVVTGVGAVTALGGDVDALWTAILEGRDGIRPARRLETPALAAQHAALVPDAGWTARVAAAARGEGEHEPCAELAITAAREALRRAGLDGPWGRDGRPPAARVALALGTSAGGILSRSAYELTPPADGPRRHRLLARSGFHVQTAAVAAALGVTGPRLTLSSACASSAHAVAHAADLVASGRVDVALAGGADVAAEDIIAGFHAMGAIAPGPCAPFSEPVGMNVGEGAGFLVLEAAAHARARGAAPLAALLGYGLSADGHHATAPDPAGAGLARAVSGALADAGAGAAAIAYVNAHGTGTEANDPAEWRALCRALGEHAARIPVSSTKSYFGHTLGAAGALELIVTLLAMERGVVPPTLRFTRPRGTGPVDPVAAPAPRPHRVRVALSTNAAFGGANTALLVGAPEAAPEPAAAPAEPVVLLGAGAVAAHGTGDLLAALRRGAPCFTPVDPAGAPVPLPEVAGLVPPFALEALVRGVDPRGLDPITRELLAAAALALRDAGLRVRGPLRDRAGLYVGASHLPWQSSQAFWGSIRERGFARASAPAFARIVMNAAAGEVAAALGLRGPHSLFAGGPGSGLVAAIHAAWALSSRRDADLIVAGAADEIGWGQLADHAFQANGAASAPPVLGEGAACVALARASWASAQGLRPVAAVAGAGLAGPDGLAGAIREALGGAAGGAPVAIDEVDAIFGAADGRAASVERELAALREVFGARAAAIPRRCPAPVLGASECLDALSLAAAAEALRAGEARAALVIAADELGGSAALVLRRE